MVCYGSTLDGGMVTFNFNGMNNITGKYLIGFNPLVPADVVKAEERGILKLETAYEILEGLLSNHDHKDNCDCYGFYGKLKEWRKEPSELSYADKMTPKESLQADYDYENYIDQITER